jgi:hypothetical protein
MNLFEAVNGMNPEWHAAPIYRKGVKLPSGHESTGKAPLHAARSQHFSPEQAAAYCMANPESFGAVGIFFGPISNGLLGLDIDNNLDAIMGAHHADLKAAPQVRSTRKNAGKFLFYAPQEQWDQLGNASAAVCGNGSEILWAGKQGVFAGVYPGKEGTSEPGEYRLVSGDLRKIPMAPEWVLKSMREAAAPRCRKGLGLSEMMTIPLEQRLETVLDCLSVIPVEDYRANGDWAQIGMMVNAHVPEDEGLEAWSAWSRSDEFYADEWSHSDPCAARWAAGFNGGRNRLDIGSLIFTADKYDPERKRIKNLGQSLHLKELLEPVQKILEQATNIPFAEMIKAMDNIQELPDLAERRYEVRKLAMRCGYRDNVSALRRDFMTHKTKDRLQAINLADLKLEPREFIIPNLMVDASTTLMYGKFGAGKSSTALMLAKAVAQGGSFSMRGQEVPVKHGKVMILNGDQPLTTLDEQAKDLELDYDSGNYVVIPDFELDDYPTFMQLMEEHKPVVVIVDSIAGCSKGADEVKAEYADPLYWFTRNNGSTFHGTHMIFLGHENANGECRGTKQLQAAVEAVWRCEIPSKEAAEKLPAASRIITIQKCRQSLTGNRLLLVENEDLSMDLKDWVAPASRTTRSATLGDKILARLDVISPETRTLAQLQQDTTIGGTVKGVRKSIYRLVNKGLITFEEHQRPGGGSPTKYYSIVSAKRTGGRGDSLYSSNNNNINNYPVVERGVSCPSGKLEKEGVRGEEKKGILNKDRCPLDGESEGGAVALTSAGKESTGNQANPEALKGHPSHPLPDSPHQAAIANVMEDGWKMWD